MASPKSLMPLKSACGLDTHLAHAHVHAAWLYSKCSRCRGDSCDVGILGYETCPCKAVWYCLCALALHPAT